MFDFNSSSFNFTPSVFSFQDFADFSDTEILGVAVGHFVMAWHYKRWVVFAMEGKRLIFDNDFFQKSVMFPRNMKIASTK